MRAGGTAVFATIGDPNLYSTFTYVAHTVRALVAGVEVRTVPGITAMQDLAARSGTVLAEGSEPLTLFPYTAGDGRLRGALDSGDTVVVYKGGRHLPDVLDAVATRAASTTASTASSSASPARRSRAPTSARAAGRTCRP